MIWACFKTHDVMALYVDSQFENHPTIAAEFTKFLTTNSGNESITTLEATVKEMKADVKEAKSKAAVSKADVATGKADTAKAALESMIKKLDKK